MAKEILNNLQKGIFEIKHLIQSDSDIRKMLLIDTKNALEGDEQEFELATPHIVVSAVFDITEEPFNKNTIMSIVLHRGSFNDELNTISGVVKINILTRSPLWELDNHKIRPLEIANRVIKILNNNKISPSHKLFFSSLELAILNDNVSGYSAIFFIEEGSGMDEKF